MSATTSRRRTASSAATGCAWSTDTPLDTIVDATVDAVEKDERHVRYPKRALLFPLLAEAPRRLSEMMLVGVKHQA